MQNNLSANIIPKELVEDIKLGNVKTFEKLYFTLFDKLFHFAYRRTQSSEISKDLVQETFTKIWLNRNSLDSQKSIKAYLYKTLSNLIIDYYKSASSKNESLDNVKELSENELLIDLKIDLQTAIDNLSEQQKSVFLMSRYDGFKYSEIAEICEISVKAVEKRMSGALTCLRNYFSKS